MKRVIVTPKNEQAILLSDIDMEIQELIVFDDLPHNRLEIGKIKMLGNRQWYIQDKTTSKPHRFKTINKVYFDSIYLLDIVLKEFGYVIFTK